MDNYAAGREKRKQLLLMLCQNECDRLEVWAHPVSKYFQQNIFDVTLFFGILLLHQCLHCFNKILLLVFIFIFREPMPVRPKLTPEKWIEHARIAFSVDPRIAFALASRFPTNVSLKTEITQLVQVCFACMELLELEWKEFETSVLLFMMQVVRRWSSFRFYVVIVDFMLSIPETFIDLSFPLFCFHC